MVRQVDWKVHLEYLYHYEYHCNYGSIGSKRKRMVEVLEVVWMLLAMKL